MASVRGLLNIQYLNESTHARNAPRSGFRRRSREPGRRRDRVRERAALARCLCPRAPPRISRRVSSMSDRRLPRAFSCSSEL